MKFVPMVFVLAVSLSGCTGLRYVEKSGSTVTVGYYAGQTPWGAVEQAARDKCGGPVRFVDTKIPTAAIFRCE